MNSLIKFSLTHLYRIIKVYSLLALLGAVGVVIVGVTTGLKWVANDHEVFAFRVLSEVLILLVSSLGMVAIVPTLIEELKSAVISWKQVQAQFDKEIDHLYEQIIPPEIGPRLKS